MAQPEDKPTKEDKDASYQFEWAKNIASAPRESKEDLLAQGGANLRDKILETVKKRKTLLHEAGRNASLSVFRFIFEAPEKPNGSFYLTRDEKKALLETRSQKNGRTPFHHLARCGIRFSDGHMINTLSESSLSTLGQKDFIRATEYLLSQAENLGVEISDLINVQERTKKWTALAWTAFTGNEMMVDLFLDHGAKASLKTNINRTPAMLAENSRDKVLRLKEIQTSQMDIDYYHKIAERFSYISSGLNEALQGVREGGGRNI